MNILRKLGAGLCATLLSLGLFGIAWSNVGIATIHNRTTVKGWLDKSGFYTKIADVALEKIKTGNTDKGGDPSGAKSSNDSLPITDPQVQAVAKTAFSPEFLKTNIEKVLDGGYNWLDGSSKTLNFSVDLTSAKDQLAIGLGNYAATKAAALPVCATNEPIDSFDAFTAICRPKNLAAGAVGQEVHDKIATGDEFLANPILTANDLKVKDDNGKEIALDGTQQADVAKKVYKLSGLVPLMFGLMSLIAALGIVLLSKDRLKGIRRVGSVLLVTGIVLLITYMGLGALSNMASQKLTENSQAGMVAQNKLIVDVAQVIFMSIQKVLIVYTVGYIVLGIIAIITGSVLKKRRDGDKKPVEEKDRDAAAEAVKDDKPVEKDTPKPEVKEPRKIQL